MKTCLRFIAALTLSLTAGAAFAQAPAPAPAAKTPPAAPAKATPPGPPLPAPPANYAYTIDGRRDPFVSLLNRGTEARGKPKADAVKRADGVAGMQTAELVVRGIIQSRGAWIAMVSGADNKVYTVRAGDRLADGIVRTITAQAVVIFQEVNDPLSLEKQREVRKFLRGGEEVK
ncbi:MAG: pilus assembly protein PilP [Vicinamibacterales bacterium]